ncbi:NadS family protein [Parathalassolituus penaei]|uniref:NadS family protein n=1 Tax=Parathalassolituus penaei TaxID=2997323 RepID=A0A9X3ECG7_9GAMM|nr:NadS family protein [Parathalassolituus penaei]MCY0964586.1 NadS family protein [Parathalassolituus penaei]
MKDELFADLLASAEEMVAIETGVKAPAPEAVHVFDTVDVRAIREATGRSRDEFAVLIGTSVETVKSWENRRRNPTGPTQKLLLLIQHNPVAMTAILEQGAH